MHNMRASRLPKSISRKAGLSGELKNVPLVESSCHFLKTAVSMLDRQTTPLDPATYVYLIRCCGYQKDLRDCRRIHAHIIASGIDQNTTLANLLVEMYGNCRSVVDAWNVFNRLYRKNLFSWNLMIQVYARHGQVASALQLYLRMQMEGVKPNKFTFFPILSASGSLQDLDKGRAIHKEIVSYGFDSDIAVRTGLLNMYSKCGSLEDCLHIFAATQERDVVLWNSMIAAYTQNGCGKKALDLFRQMGMEGENPDKITFLSTLDACSCLASLENGKLIHEQIVASGLQSHVIIRTALVSMYGKCGSLKDAHMVFNEVYEKDTILWNAMIAAYAQNGHGRDALELFKQMQLDGIKPNQITFLAALDACSSSASIAHGKAIHEHIVASKLELDVAVGNALVSMYGKCGVLEEAHKVFNAMHERDVISWTAIITAYAQNGYYKEALGIFRQMILNGVNPDVITFLSMLDACANLTSLENGRVIHGHIVDCGLNGDIAVVNALINMYGKCGGLRDAHMVFDEMRERDVISWNAMISAYTRNGGFEEAFELFRQMLLDDIKPNIITFVSLLSACSHTGLLSVGWRYFVSMSRDYDITPSENHYVLMSDILGRGGSLDEAEDLINNMPVEPSAVVWSTLLGACRIHGDVERGTHAAEQVFELNPNNVSLPILLSNIYVAAGRLNDAEMVRKA